MVRAQFKCTEVRDSQYGQEVRLKVDMDGCSEFTPYTPSGSMEFFIEKSAKSIGAFEVGVVYNVDFAPAE